MPYEASLNAGTRRVHRTALGQLLALWGALPRTIRRFATDFGAVFAEEGREVPARLAWIAIALVIAGILIIAGWLLLCVATASWLVAAQGWRWEMALYLIALANVLLALIAIIVAYRSLKSPLFPFTSYELHRLRSSDDPQLEDPRAGVPAEAPAALAHAGPRERALMRSEAELEARLSEVRRVTPQLIATPSVIAAAAGVGLVAGYLTKRKSRETAATYQAQGVPLGRQLLNVAFGQLSSVAVAAALREIQRRAGHDGRLF